MHVQEEHTMPLVLGKRKQFALVLLFCLLVVVAAMPAEHVVQVQDGAISTYIVHVAHSNSPRPTRNTARLTRAYTSFLRDTLPMGMNAPTPSILYSYAHAMTGFAARLTARQAAHLETQPSVLAVIPDMLYDLHTTLSSSFLELKPSSPLIMQSYNATDVVIGIIDTGIYPEDRASFAADPSMMPPPPSFRGGCVSADNFVPYEYCNNKLVGAKFFHKGHAAMMSHMPGSAPASGSPLDIDGHGTHVASIAAGAPVPDASFFGYARGVARGTASGARIASYNVCGGGCTGSDIFAGINEAIADKVDVLSISLGGNHSNLYSDAIMIGSFRAVREGIFVSTSAGNDGPNRATVTNLAPWVCTVGASSMNREFRARIEIRGETFTGYSLYSGTDPSGYEAKPLVCVDWCDIGKLDRSKVEGKIVLCPRGGVAQGYAIKEAGGVGAIFGSRSDYGSFASAEPHLIPSVLLNYTEYKSVRLYCFFRAEEILVRITGFGTNIGFNIPASPRVASFSSRGPNPVEPGILKPDIIAPGVEILGAWTGENSPSEEAFDTRRVKFNIISGTSMATPHVSGIAALLKAARPKWSPAVIKSAMMTTAYKDNDADPPGVITDMATGKEAGPYELGAGHVDPNGALDPGLVYDADEDDYISFLCSLGYTPPQIAIFTGGCAEAGVCLKHPTGDHNYPAFSVALKSWEDKVTQRRVVRNVGSKVNAMYILRLRASRYKGVSIVVDPDVLKFDEEHQTQEYTVTFSLILSEMSNSFQRRKEYFSSLVWIRTDGSRKDEVVSPIVVTWPTLQSAQPVM